MVKYRNYQYLIYFISAVIVVTLGIQVYWNIKNYKTESRNLINEMHISLEQAVNNYYIRMAKDNSLGIQRKGRGYNSAVDSLFTSLSQRNNRFQNVDSIRNIFPNYLKGADSNVFKKGKNRLYRIRSIKDSILRKESLFLNDFTTKIFLSIRVDTLDTERFDRILKRELNHKNLDVQYGMEFKNGIDIPQVIHQEVKANSTNITCSNNSLLPDGSSLCIYFTNNTIIVLKRNLVGIILSTLLVGSVIACLLFLLKITNKQKQLAEVKNDLIGNITHEFKTPIATIGVALEAIENFNTANDPEKTKKYVQTSNIQLGKLNLMVEKLLETATLDKDSLSLKKTETNLMEIVQNLIDRHRTLAPEKVFEFSATPENIRVMADAFHLENALNNILDNAVKYGGDKITTNITTANNHVRISIKDDGKNLTSTQAKQIFEKFYRVSKGNRHDVKGFGIGLYYTKKIIEGHNGSIEVVLKDSTNFIITLSHG